MHKNYIELKLLSDFFGCKIWNCVNEYTDGFVTPVQQSKYRDHYLSSCIAVCTGREVCTFYFLCLMWYITYLFLLTEDIQICYFTGTEVGRRPRRYQSGNQNPYIEEEQTTQWPTEKVQKNKQLSTKHTHETKDLVTRTPLKTGGTPMFRKCKQFLHH